jgi:ketosteroid isomerase-like protein
MFAALLLKMMAGRSLNDVNKRDAEKILSHWTDDSVMVYPGHIWISGRWEGKEKLTEFFQLYFDQFKDVHYSGSVVAVKNPFDFLFCNTIMVGWNQRVVNKYDEIYENSGISMIKIRFAKVTLCKDCYFDVATFEKAWRE